MAPPGARPRRADLTIRLYRIGRLLFGSALAVASLFVPAEALAWPAWAVAAATLLVTVAPVPIVHRVWGVTGSRPWLAVALAAADALAITVVVGAWPGLAVASIVLYCAAAIFHATASGVYAGLVGAAIGLVGVLTHTDELAGTTWLDPVVAATILACITAIVIVVGAFARLQQGLSDDLDAARRQLEQATGAARTATTAALERSAELERAREQLLRLASHELRTPLTAVAGALEVLAVRGEALSPDRHAALLEVARRSTTDLVHVSEQVLDLVRMIEPRGEVFSHPFSVADVLDTGLRRVEHLLADRLVTVDVDDVPMALGEPGATARIVENLLSNVVTHTPANAALHVALRTESDHVVLEVRDEGSGLPPDVQPLTDPMVRGEGATERGRGLGIGLALCRRYAEAQGASFSLTGGPDGTTARLRLRAARNGVPAPGRTHTSRSTEHAATA